MIFQRQQLVAFGVKAPFPNLLRTSASSIEKDQLTDVATISNSTDTKFSCT